MPYGVTVTRPAHNGYVLGSNPSAATIKKRIGMRAYMQRPPIKGSPWSLVQLDYESCVYIHNRDASIAISSIALVREKKEDEPHLEWLVSFSGKGKTVLPDDKIKQYLKDFNFSDAEEDNHEPGFARKFFLAVEEKHRKKCECKDEEQVRLSENYVYSRKIKK